MEKNSLRALLALSFGEHRRSWHTEDAAFYKHAQLSIQNRRPLGKDELREFAKTYGVSRGLAKGAEEEYSALVWHHTRNAWVNDPELRIEIARNIISDSLKKKLTHGRQASLCSKVLWFLCPTKWFMFDRLASAALRVQHDNDPPARLSQFQRDLRQYGVHELVDELRPILEAHERHLHPERLIDKLLMFVGLSLFEDLTPQEGREGKEWNAPSDADYAFADDALHAFERSGLIARLRHLPLP